VDPSSLGKTIAALRKVLQADGPASNFIVTAPGRGYRLGVLVVFEPNRTRTIAETSFETPVARTPTRSPRLRLLLLGAAVLLLVVAAWTAGRQFRSDADIATAPPAAVEFKPPPHSIAVLAFTNLSGDPSQEYFADGLSEQLIDSLSRVGSLHVAARLSAFSFKNKSPTIDEVARKLNVGLVLEGSVRRDGKRLRVTAQLVDGLTGYELWSHSYDRDESDVFQVQGELAQAVASALKVSLTEVDIARLTLGGTHNPQALDAYLRAMAALEGPDESSENAQRVIAAFDEAVALDPHFAIAQAQRAAALWHIASVTEHPTVELIRRLKDGALQGARLAVSLAPDLAEAHMAMGLALDNTLPDFSRQEAEFARARELAPASSEIARRYGRFEVLAGRTALGIRAAEQAVALDPLTPKAYYYLAWTLYLAGDGDGAIGALEHARQLGAAETVYTSALRGLVALLKGDAETARRLCLGKISWQIDVCLAIANEKLGRLNEAMTDLARLQAAVGETGAYNYAQVYAQWGQTDTALHWLESAYDLRDTGMIQLRADPLLAPLRQQPRFLTVEKRLGFPP
jgi:TolB-like protein/Flp pilus assembly protein TadD